MKKILKSEKPLLLSFNLIFIKQWFKPEKYPIDYAKKRFISPKGFKLKLVGKIYTIKLKNGQEKEFGWIINEGYPKGDSDYFIATEEIVADKPEPFKELKKVKWAIFNAENGERVSDYFDWITSYGLVKGQSPYFRGEIDRKEALFTLDKQETDWYQKIRDRGALTGESDYYWGKNNGYYALYNIKTGEKLTPDFKSSVLAGAVVGTSENLVVGSFGEEIFFIYDIKEKKIVSPEFDEDKLIEILKHGDLEKALAELTS